MATVETFSRALIESAIESIGWKYLMDRDGDFVIRFGKEPKCPAMTLYIMAQGARNDVLSITITVEDHEVPKAHWPEALAVCNEWNQKKRWPKMYLLCDEKEEIGRLVAEGQIDCEMGIHQELLVDYIRTQLGAASAFWEWVIENNKLSD